MRPCSPLGRAIDLARSASARQRATAAHAVSLNDLAATRAAVNLTQSQLLRQLYVPAST